MDNHIAIEVFTGTGSDTYFFLTDERGNVVALTDDSANILERYRYRVYGEHEVLDDLFEEKDCGVDTCYAGNVHNFLWGGSLYEPETNLYWMRNRYYHIGMHRFINQDPIGIWGDANNLGNGFAYVAGMVIEASDPTGLQQSIITGVEKIIVDKTYKDNISAGKSEEVARVNAEFARLGISLYCSPVDNVLDTADTFKSVLDLLDGLNGQSVPEQIETEETKEDPWKKEDGLFPWSIPKPSDVEGQPTGHDILWATKYTNAETGETKYVFDDGTEVIVAADGTTTCSGPSCGKLVFYPSDPDSIDSIQTFFMNQLLKKMLKGEKKRFQEIMEEEGPVIKYDDNGRKVFIFNPYYRGKDPMKEVIWRHQNSDGTWGFIRNPFAPGGAPTWSNTYEKFQQSGFIQPEVDPYWQ